VNPALNTCINTLIYLPNRRVREPYARWCERSAGRPRLLLD